LFCPLCKSEYRPGVTWCKDCNLPLVMTHEEAHGTPTSNLWEGSDQQTFNEITTALEDAAIPFLSEPRAGADQMGKVVFVGLLRVVFWRFGLFRKSAEKQKGWRIKVLQSDYPRSTKIVLDLSKSDELEMK
jgi:hypothetical protein